MELPLFGFCEGDLYIFPTVSNAVAEMEIDDVQNRSWTVYDRNGHVLNVEIARQPLYRWFPMRLVKSEHVLLVETGERLPEQMADQLRRYLEAVPSVGASRDLLPNASLRDLVEIAIHTLV
jgi:hypothetical protein